MCMIMLKSKNKDNKNKKQCYISVPSQIITSSSLQSLLLSPTKAPKTSNFKIFKNPRFYFSLFFLFGFLGMLKMWYNIDPFVPFTPNPPCSSNSQQEFSVMSNGVLSSQPVSSVVSSGVSISQLKIGGVEEKMVKSEEKIGFWKQPDGLGYRPSLDFSREYEKESVGIMKDRSKYLVVVVSGGMNQQRNQIVDAVVIARILGATLVVPILQVNVIWGDESEFSDIFDVEHFKTVLANDVRIISSLPSTHVMSRPVEEKHTPLHVSPQWIRGRYLRRMRREGVLLLRSLDSRLSKDLPSNLQKLRCKVAFHALKYAPPILDLGNKL